MRSTILNIISSQTIITDIIYLEFFHILLLPLMVVVVPETDDIAVAVAVAVVLNGVNEALVVAIDVLTLVGETGSEMGEEGGEAFISSSSGDLLVAFIFGAPFKAELLAASCRYADSLGNISLTSSIS